MRQAPCPECNGTGGYAAPPGECVPCQACDGTGRAGGNPLLRVGGWESVSHELASVERELQRVEAHASELRAHRDRLRGQLDKHRTRDAQ